MNYSARSSAGVDRAARLECIELAGRFFHYLDRRDYEEMANLFTPDGCWIRQGQTLSGRTEILARMAERPIGLVTRHLLCNPIVDVQDRILARIRYDVSVYSQRSGSAPRHVQILSGEDVMVNKADRWLVAKKQAEQIMVFPSE